MEARNAISGKTLEGWIQRAQRREGSSSVALKRHLDNSQSLAMAPSPLRSPIPGKRVSKFINVLRTKTPQNRAHSRGAGAGAGGSGVGLAQKVDNKWSKLRTYDYKQE